METAMKVITRKLEAASRFVVFSDCHRGDGSAGDEFARNSMVYKFALEHYLREGFTLIELGDAEELWENNDFARIYITHTSVYDLLARFHDPDPARTRYIKIWGNHDLDWQDDVGPLRSIFPGIEAYEAMILDAGDGGCVFFLHGHQADPACYGWRARVLRWLVRHLWRGLQNINIGDPTTRAAENPGRCNKVDEKLMEMAREKGTVVVAGHTHRPVFAGLSLTERRLLEAGGAGPPGIARKDGPEAIYFNTGACVLPRCITGIEITAEGKMHKNRVSVPIYLFSISAEHYRVSAPIFILTPGETSCISLPVEGSLMNTILKINDSFEEIGTRAIDERNCLTVGEILFPI